MKQSSNLSLLSRFGYELVLKSRWFLGTSHCSAFAGIADAGSKSISRIHVINLDRHKERWEHVYRELCLVHDGSRKPLAGLVEKFSAIDARSKRVDYTRFEIETYYSLADQLFVEPDPRIPHDLIECNQHIAMSRQEIAVALSHIRLWQKVADGDNEIALLLEDDVYFRPGFSRILNAAWRDVPDSFDILYLSYASAKAGIRKEEFSDALFRPLGGIWQLSGYVLSKQGAKKLLDQLPVRGPVDLWINLQFERLDVFATCRSIIDQRPDCTSSNSYSILPILSKVGVLEDGPSLFKTNELIGPVFGFGASSTGLTSLAMALSILGYRCCSDVSMLPDSETKALMTKLPSKIFNAYVNVGSLDRDTLIELSNRYPNAKYIFVPSDDLDELPSCDAANDWSIFKSSLDDQPGRCFQLPITAPNIWQQLCQFLECNLPACEFPYCKGLGQRLLERNISSDVGEERPNTRALKFDSSPWIVKESQWLGLPIESAIGSATECSKFFPGLDVSLTDLSDWILLNETFPSNLALFKPQNISIASDRIAKIVIKSECAGVREYTSASIVSQQLFHYGRFSASIRPPKSPGLITGIFLHRNSPRQEIDIEFLGKDTTKMLINVYYNPGSEGTKYDYGYRGTPVLVDLGFDASLGFHNYSIEWSPSKILWSVDDQVVYERHNWGPTPIPHMPMQFFINCWPSMSEELAGKFNPVELPVYCEIESIDLQATPANSIKQPKDL